MEDKKEDISEEGNAVKLGDSIIGEKTKITLTVKTALWIIGGAIALFSTIFTYSYFDIKSDVENYKTEMSKKDQEFIKQVEDNISTKLEKQRDKDEQFIQSIESIKGDIKLILDRTQRTTGDGSTTGAPTINNNTPETTIPKRNH